MKKTRVDELREILKSQKEFYKEAETDQTIKRESHNQAIKKTQFIADQIGLTKSEIKKALIQESRDRKMAAREALNENN